MNATQQTNGKTLPTFCSINLDVIDASPTQPRKTFADIEEMAADIKLHGILQPVLLRPRPGKAKRFELVFGERRLRGAKLAGLKEIPATVRELTDAEVVEIQIVENAKRSDIHPLEEAEAYETLHKKHGYSVEEIAAKVGKSTATIYTRLKFCALVPEARKAFLEGKLTASTALLLVRIPHPDLQKEATRKITAPDYNGEVSTTSEAADIIEREFMMELGRAPFDTKDAELVAGAPGCTTCPKRTGNQGHLFADASSKDLCTDPKCFKQKVEADWSKKAEAAKQRKLTVLQGKKAEEALGYGSEYIDLDAKNYEDKRGRTYRECIAKTKAEVPTTLARDANGGARELVVRKDLAKIGVVPKRQTNGLTEEAKKNRAAEAKKKEKQKAVVEKLVAKSGKIRGAAFELAFARTIVGAVARLVWHDTARAVCSRRELEVKDNDPRGTIAKHAKSLGVEQCREIVVEILASESTSRVEFAALFKVA